MSSFLLLFKISVPLAACFLFLMYKIQKNKATALQGELDALKATNEKQLAKIDKLTNAINELEKINETASQISNDTDIVSAIDSMQNNTASN